MSTQNRRRSSDDDDDEDMTCRERLEDLYEDKFWCKLKIFALSLTLLNVLFIAYKFYYLASQPAVYRVRVHVAEKILYPYWFASCLICVLFALYGVFEEYEWALTTFQCNTFIEGSFLDMLLIAELVAVCKHPDKEPWKHLSVGMTVARMILVTLWHSVIMYLCSSFIRGLEAKWKDETPTLLKMCCPCRKPK